MLTIDTQPIHSMTHSKNTGTSAVTIKTVAAISAICLLWLLAIGLAYLSISDPNALWHWQLARSIPAFLVATYASGLLTAWLRHTLHNPNR